VYTVIYLIVVQILISLFSFVPDSFAYDDSCIVSGTYDGIRCAKDLNGSGDAEDCSELLICKRPDGGTCTGSVSAGYDCSSTGQHYADLQTCQNSCGGTLPFACPPDIPDTVCNGSSSLTQLSYRDMYPNNFDQNVTYTYALTKTAVPRSSYTGLSTTYGGHPASALNSADRNFYWQTFGSGPFFVKEGALYSDVLFYSPDQNACYRADSFDGSRWRPRDYCPGTNCTNYNAPSGSYYQRWEKIQSTCSPTSFCQDMYFSKCLPTYLNQTGYLYDASTATFIYATQKSYYTGLNSGSFYYNNSYEVYWSGYWYGTEIRCISSSYIEGYNVCNSFYQRYYGPIEGGSPYGYDRNGTLYTNQTCNQNTSHWIGTPYAQDSLYVVDTLPGQYTSSAYKGTICHYPGTNSGTYSNSQSLSGNTITTTCASAESVPTCNYGTVNRCKTYNQCMAGTCWLFGFGDTCSNTSAYIPNLLAGNVTMYYNVSGKLYFDKPVEYRDVPLNLIGIHQWDAVKCTPCQSASTAVITDPADTPVGPDVVPDPNATCTNFYMFSGASKKCRRTSVTTIFANCCDLTGWFASWCNDAERELKKRKQAGTCHEVGTYCSKKIKFIGLCIERKKSYCCFNSKLSRIVNEQGRPQIGKTWGGAKDPYCKGFTPAEFGRIDFSRIDLSEYVNDIQGTVNTGVSTQEITKGIQEWMINQNNPSPLENK
jgi:hypothetical protein